MMETVNSQWVLPEELRNLALDGHREAVDELIALFKQDVARRLRVVRQAVEAGDLATAAAQAHTIKGSAIQMGAMNLEVTCRHIELDAAHRVTASLERLLDEADAEMHVLEETMR